MKEQTILIRTRTKKSGKGGDEEKFDAREMASKLSECVSKLNKDVKFDSKSGLWYDMGVLVVARPGSGKTWMMQQIVHFMCECYLDDDKSAYKFVPVLFHVQRIARLYREMNEQKRFQVEQTIEARYKGGKQYYPGVIHAVLGVWPGAILSCLTSTASDSRSLCAITCCVVCIMCVFWFRLNADVLVCVHWFRPANFLPHKARTDNICVLMYSGTDSRGLRW